MQSLQSLPGSWKDGFFSFPPTQAGQDSHSFTTAASSQFLLSAAWGGVAAPAWGKRESLSSLEEKQETRELPCGRFWDTSCLFWPPRRFVEPNYASSLLRPCTTPLPRHQHWLVPYRCSLAAWGHLGSSCIRPAPLIHTGWGPGAKQSLPCYSGLFN